MKSKQFATMLYSTGGVVVLLAVLIALNFIVGAVSFRADLTEGHVYTLSPGTRAVLAKLEAPVKLRFYYTQGAAVPVGLKTFAKRIEDLLNEYRTASGGRVIIEKFNPLPDSDAEDSAELDGVEGQLTNTGEKFYLGLAIAFLDKKAALPVLTPDRERLMEYDITRAIAQVTAAEKPVVGVMSALPVMGRTLNPLTQQRPSEPWVLISELKRSFELKEIKVDAKKIPDDIKVLLVIHPRDMLEDTEYAIDQFVLRGGKLIAFVDPYAYFDQQPDMQNPFGGSRAGQSMFYRLFKAWGVDVDMGKVIADMTFGSGEGPRLLPTLLSLNTQALNRDDVVTSQLGTLLIPFGGAFKGKPAEGLTQTVLAHTSKNAMPVDLIIATLSGEPSTRGFEPSGEEMPLAIRLTGTFHTAYPDGKPKPQRAPADQQKKADNGKNKAATEPQIKRSAEENSVVLVADVDLLTDNAAVDVQEIFGQRVVIPRNGNLALAQGLVEQLAGDDALISLRSRAAFSRPLTVVREMEAQAQQQYLGKIKELEDSLNQTQEKLQSLQKARGSASATILTAEQQAELENFRKKAVETRLELKDLRKNLRVETDRLELWTKAVNIAFIPLLVALIGLVLALARRGRARAT
ncbi:MAG: Gldg family protein [Betaproteobacteria bacterium]|nr:Gldg family protein [Betaproteobacteria bacterium]MDH3435561.1 Gldg family protein [Betaproteobacteria bacterium]